jgi:hypothetical protein
MNYIISLRVDKLLKTKNSIAQMATIMALKFKPRAPWTD